jgi:hypothetical protein
MVAPYWLNREHAASSTLSNNNHGPSFETAFSFLRNKGRRGALLMYPGRADVALERPIVELFRDTRSWASR